MLSNFEFGFHKFYEILFETLVKQAINWERKKIGEID